MTTSSETVSRQENSFAPTQISPFAGSLSLSTCQMSAALAAEPAANAELALTQLVDHIRSVLISLLSDELQSSLSTLRVAIETLADGDGIPAQAQRRMLVTALAELQQLCDAVEAFSGYANQIWSQTSEFLQSRSTSAAVIDFFRSMLLALPAELARYQTRQEKAVGRLVRFLQGLDNGSQGLARLHTSQKIAVLEEQRRQMLAVVNHELRTPLTTLQVCFETLHHDLEQPDETRLVLVEIAANDLHRLSRLMGDLSLLRRLEAGQVCFRSEWVDLKTTIQATLSSFLKQTPERILPNIQIESPPHLSAALADGDRLVEVINRLLENACRFTVVNGEAKLQAKVEVRMAGSADSAEASTKGSASNSMFVISVSDTGRGIRSNQLKPIFDCFHQEEDYLQRTISGAGVGLTICRYLVEGMGGRIWAESSGKDRGSRFSFTLPQYS